MRESRKTKQAEETRVFAYLAVNDPPETGSCDRRDPSDRSLSAESQDTAFLPGKSKQKEKRNVV